VEQPPGPVGQVVRAPKTAELIAAHIRRGIVRGDLREGDALPSEAELITLFAVSRPTLREAFRILETESLISVRRGSRGGARVVTPSLSVAARYVGLLLQVQGTTIADVYQARLVVEPVCARLLAVRRTEGDLADLRAAIARLRAAVESAPEGIPSADDWTAVTSSFRDLLMQRSGSKTLAVQGGVLQDIVATHLAMTVARGATGGDVARANFRRSIRSHMKLLDLVEARDGEQAEAHWRTHMEVAAKSLLRDDFRSASVVDLFS
jgi:GntR family transcriptional regulator, transcriptional repressor for pyruvate dehydrogenase complex